MKDGPFGISLNYSIDIPWNGSTLQISIDYNENENALMIKQSSTK